MLREYAPQTVTQQVICHDQEKAALLEFQHSFRIDCAASTLPFAFPKMYSWREQAVVPNGSSAIATDYCACDGVECDKETDCVIGLDRRSSCLYALQASEPKPLGIPIYWPTSLRNLIIIKLTYSGKREHGDKRASCAPIFCIRRVKMKGCGENIRRKHKGRFTGGTTVGGEGKRWVKSI